MLMQQLLLAFLVHVSVVYSFALTARPAIRNYALSMSRDKVKASIGLLLGACLPFMQINNDMNIITAVPNAHALNQQFKLPPIDTKDPNRCTLTSSNIGQANAGRDKLYDVRNCDLRGQSAAGKDLSGIIAADADFSGVNFKEAQISKALARDSKFVGCDFTNAILDRVSFDGSDMSSSVLTNSVLSGTTFEKANLKDTDFTDAYLGPFDLKNLCANPSLKGKNPTTGADTFESAGCAFGSAKNNFKEQ